MGTAWHASHSQIYPELARLHEAGMVEVVGEGARNSRTYAVTDAGHDEIRRWLIEGEPNRAQRNETAVRWFLLGLLEPDDRRAAVERELAYAEEYVANLQAIAAQLDALPHKHPFRRTVDSACAPAPSCSSGCASRPKRRRVAMSDRAPGSA